MPLEARAWTAALCIVVSALPCGAANDDGDVQPPIELSYEHYLAIRDAMSDGELSAEEYADLLKRGVPKETLDRIRRSGTEKGAGVQRPGVTYIAIRLRNPINARETLLYSSLIALSDAQWKYVQHLHEEYLDRAAEYWPVYAGSVWEQSAHAAQLDHRTFARADALDEIVQSSARADRLFREFDDRQFFDMLVPVLGEEQIERLQRARWLRERTVHRIDRTYHPGAEVDLTTLYISLHRALPEQFPALAASDAVDQVLAAHERQATPLVRDLVAALDRGDVSYARQRAMLASAGGDAGFASDARAARKTDAERLRRLARRLATLNVRTVAALGEQLSDEAAQRLDFEYRRRAYPPVHAESELPILRKMFHHVDELDGLDEELLLGLHAIRDHALGQMERLTVRMEEAYVEWRTYAAGGFFDGGKYQQHASALTELREERRKLARRALDEVSSLIESNAPEQVAAQWRGFMEAMRASLEDGVQADWLSTRNAARARTAEVEP